MPQPLSRVKPDALICLTARLAVIKNPKLVAKVGHAIAVSSHIENLFAGIMVTMLGAQAKPAAAMLRSLHSLGVKSQAIRAAAEEALEPDLLDLFTVIAEICDSASKHRNRFVHWAWAESPDVPDALLFIDPKALLAHETSSPGTMHPNEGRGLVGPIDTSAVLVYRDNSMNLAIKALDDAHDKLSAFRMCVLPFPQLKKFHEPILQRLVSAPDVAPKLAKLRALRKNNRAE